MAPLWVVKLYWTLIIMTSSTIIENKEYQYNKDPACLKLFTNMIL